MANSFIDAKKVHKQKQLNIIMVIVTVIALIYISARGAYYTQEHPGTAMFFAVSSSLMTITEDPLAVSFSGDFIKIFSVVGLIVGFIAYCAYDKRILNRHYTEGEQYGTAKWQTVESTKFYNRKFTEPVGKPYADSPQNTILSKNCQLSMNTRHTGLNNNVMIIGGPGSGKSFNVVRPNLLQKYGSYVITDPSAELMRTTGKFFEENGYSIKVFNLVDMPHSDCYNPFNYIRNEEDVLTLIQCLIKSTESEGKSGGDPFWEKAETALLEALIFYLVRFQDKEKQNFSMVSKLLRQAKADPKAAGTKLDSIFDEVRQFDENDICIKQYDIFKQASEKTAQSILITAATRLSPFNIDAVENLTSVDQMELELIGDRPTVVYIIVPQGNNAYAFLVNMLYSQMFDTLYYHAQMDNGDSRLKYDVRFILDEFANIGIIPAFQNKLTTMRKYGLSCMIFIQAVGQIKNLYKDDWETLMGACDTLLYLGGNELSSMEDLSKKLGDQTIRIKDSSYSRSMKGGGSDSKSFKYAKRSLLTVDEIRRLRDGYCIVVIKGQDPFYDEKYKTFDHPNAKYLGKLDTGDRLYSFNGCNTKIKSAERLEETRRKMKENTLKKSAEARRPSDKAIQMKPVVPDYSNPTKEETKALAKQVASRTSTMAIDKEEAVRNGATVIEAQRGYVTVLSGKPDGKAATAGKSMSKPALKPNITRSTDDILNDFTSIF